MAVKGNMVITLLLRNGATVRLDRVIKWARRADQVEWQQHPDAKVQLSYVDPDEIVAVTREDSK